MLESLVDSNITPADHPKLKALVSKKWPCPNHTTLVGHCLNCETCGNRNEEIFRILSEVYFPEPEIAIDLIPKIQKIPKKKKKKIKKIKARKKREVRDRRMYYRNYYLNKVKSDPDKMLARRLRSLRHSRGYHGSIDVDMGKEPRKRIIVTLTCALPSCGAVFSRYIKTVVEGRPAYCCTAHASKARKKG